MVRVGAEFHDVGGRIRKTRFFAKCSHLIRNVECVQNDGGVKRFVLDLYPLPRPIGRLVAQRKGNDNDRTFGQPPAARSEEHTSELQSRENLVCRRLLEKKKKRLPQ